jgi:O-acetyl-ADP-ribose deacetylase (regulator of RNase III)
MPAVTAVLGDLATQDVDAVVLPQGSTVPVRARWTLHALAPYYADGRGDRAALAACYERALTAAADLGAASVAFPLLGTGASGWPAAAAIEVAVGTLAASSTGASTTAASSASAASTAAASTAAASTAAASSATASTAAASTAIAEIRLVARDEPVYRRLRAAVLRDCPPPVGPGTVGALFDPPPLQFGLRGDPYLWRDLRARFADTPLPPDWHAVRRLLTDAIEQVVGEPLTGRDTVAWSGPDASVHVPEYDPGHGMSAGSVHLPWWSRTGVPIILDRFATGRGRPDPTPRHS